MQKLCFKNLKLDSCWGYGDNRIGVAMNGNIYHEKQVKELCALHALNNLFQEKGAFTKTELDNICYSLSPNDWINPHKSLLGLGNYDINVIMAALQRKDCEAIWFDKRKDPNCLNLNKIKGFILNVPSDYKFGFVFLPLKRKHWVTIREIQGSYYNLDSKLESPELIGKESEVILYLREQLESKEKELFLVVSKEVERDHTWQLDSVNVNTATSNHVQSSTAGGCNEMIRTASTETEVEWQELNVRNCTGLSNESRHYSEKLDAGGEYLDGKVMDALNLNLVSEDIQCERTLKSPLIKKDHT